MIWVLIGVGAAGAYAWTGAMIFKRTIGHTLERKRARWQMSRGVGSAYLSVWESRRRDETIRGHMWACILWPFALPVMWANRIADAQDPETTRRKIVEQQEEIARLEKELGVNENEPEPARPQSRWRMPGWARGGLL